MLRTFQALAVFAVVGFGWVDVARAQCTADSECPAPQVCRFGGCVNPAPGDVRSADPAVAPAAGACTRDVDCPGDQVCTNGVCANAAPPPSSAPPTGGAPGYGQPAPGYAAPPTSYGPPPSSFQPPPSGAGGYPAAVQTGAPADPYRDAGAAMYVLMTGGSGSVQGVWPTFEFGGKAAGHFRVFFPFDALMDAAIADNEFPTYPVAFGGGFHFYLGDDGNLRGFYLGAAFDFRFAIRPNGFVADDDSRVDFRFSPAFEFGYRFVADRLFFGAGGAIGYNMNVYIDDRTDLPEPADDPDDSGRFELQFHVGSFF